MYLTIVSFLWIQLFTDFASVSNVQKTGMHFPSVKTAENTPQLLQED